MTVTREETGFSQGTTGASDPNVPAIPAFSASAATSITITPGANSNDAVVGFSFRVMHNTGSGYALKGYVQADGSVGAGEIFQTLAIWGATITITGLTVYIPHTFAARAKNKADTPVYSEFCSESAIMNTLPDIDYGPYSANLEREVSGGNTIVDEYYGLVISGTQVAASEVTQATLPEYYGDIAIAYKLINDGSATSRIAVEYSEDGTTWAAATMGTGGDGLTGLNTNAAGKSHTYVWNSYADSGESELDTSVYLRIIPYDASPTGGDASTPVASDAFAVNNRPAIIAWENADGYTFNKDSTPTFRAIIPRLRGGAKGFPEISIYRTSGMTLVALYQSVTSIAGWEYETALNTWVAMTVAGMPDGNGSLRLRFTPPALTADEYTVNGRMGEVRDRG